MSVRILFAAAAALLGIGAAPAPKCDRACLTGLAERYMDALAARTPAKLPWATEVAFSENSVRMMIGDGLWGSVSARGARGTVVADTGNGTVAWFGRVDEHGQPSFYAMRMKVDGGKIAEVETVVRRQQGRPPFGDPTQFAFDPAYAARLSTAERTPRERMAGLIEGYYNSVAGNDGAVLTKLEPTCTHTENGVPHGASCEQEFRAGLHAATDAVRARRIVAIDEERGTAVVTGFLDRSARQQNFTPSGGAAFKAPTVYPHSMGFMTLFKIRNGAIVRVDEIANEVIYRMPAAFKE